MHSFQESEEKNSELVCDRLGLTRGRGVEILGEYRFGHCAGSHAIDETDASARVDRVRACIAVQTRIPSWVAALAFRRWTSAIAGYYRIWRSRLIIRAGRRGTWVRDWMDVLCDRRGGAASPLAQICAFFCPAIDFGSSHRVRLGALGAHRADRRDRSSGVELRFPRR